MRAKIKIVLSHQAIPFAIILIFFSLSVYKGVLTDSTMKNFDLRWLYTAGQCIALGHSPYNFESFKICWEISIGDSRIGPFVFLPTSLIYALPFSLMDWQTAQIIGDLIGIIFLIGLTVLLIKLASADAPIKNVNTVTAILVGLGISSTGIPGSLLVGQPTVATACGISFLFLYCLNRSRLNLVLGILLSSIKIHLAFFIVALCVLVAARKHTGALLLAVAIGLGCSIFMTNSIFELPFDYLESLILHSKSEISQLHRSETLIGVKSLLLKSLSFGLTGHAIFFSCISFFVVLGFIQNEHSIKELELIGLLAILSSFLAFQLKIYDMVALAPMYALAARLPVSGLMTVSLPLISLWRPNIIGYIFGTNIDSILVVNACITFLFFYFLGLLVRKYMMRSRSASGEDESTYLNR
jgi:hypothetical protein